MGRALSTAFCAALLVVSAAAFAITEGEKTALSALYATKVVTRAGKVLPGKVFSPTCDGRFPGCNRVGVIEFRTRAPGRVEVWIVSAATGKRVVTVIADRLSGAKALVRVVFYGRVGNRASGALLPDGSYLPVVKLLTQQLTFKLPNPIAIDTTPPKVIRPPRILHLALTPLKPGGPGIAVIAYRLEGPAHGVLFVDGHQSEFTYRQPLRGTLSWDGTIHHRRVPAGVYTLEMAAQDEAGNRSVPFTVAIVTVRYIALSRPRVSVRPRGEVTERVLDWPGSVRYSLDGRHGVTDSHLLHLRAPARRGGYRLVVTGGGHRASAKVVVT